MQRLYSHTRPFTKFYVVLLIILIIIGNIFPGHFPLSLFMLCHMNKIIQVPFTGRWTKIGDTYERSGRIVVAGANMFDILLLVSQWSFRHCLQMGSVGLWHISGELNMWTPGWTTSVNGKETKTSDNVCWGHNGHIWLDEFRVRNRFFIRLYLWIVITKLLPERTTISWASLWRKLNTSTSLILITASPGIKPAFSARLPPLTWKKRRTGGKYNIRKLVYKFLKWPINSMK